ncbi:MAG: hypothetical protein HY403_08935 [Elusimicrobia bacterium]|nr:hypothetical protein [Elusimicrobiota bacterium]
MLNIPSFLLLAALSAAPAAAQAPTGRAASSRDIEMKVTLESVMEKRLETVLRKVLASEDVSVVANVELLAESDRPEVEVLPGVVVKQTPSSAAPMELPASLVKRITLSVFLAHSASDADIASARAATERLVGLKPERGDVLNVEKVGAPPPNKLSRSPFIERALNPGTFLLLAWLLAACWGLIHVSRRFLDPLLGVLREAVQSRSDAESRRAAPSAEEAAAETTAAPDALAPAAPAGPDERKHPFSFIQERDLPALELLLLEQSDATAAIIVQYLSPALAARALASMTASRREDVLARMSKPALIDQAEVKKIEEAILAKIDYIMGGEEKIVSMLDQASIAMQTDMLETVRRHDPELGLRLDRRLVMIEDIALLDESGLTALSRQATVRGMAVVLRALPKLHATVLPKLKTGLGEWLTQEAALIGDLPEQVKETEMRRVHQALVRLVREGKIVLRKGVPPHSNGAESNGSTNGAH